MTKLDRYKQTDPNKEDGRRGERHHKSRLTEGQVLRIFHDRSRSDAQLARDFDVSPRTISDIHCGNSWAWLTNPVDH